MVNEIQPSYTQQINDIVEELENSRIEHQKVVRDIFVRWLWTDGQIISTHPLWEYGNKTKIIQEVSERVGYSKRYLQYAVKLYKWFPYPTVDEAMEKIYNDKRLKEKLGNRTVLTERVVIQFLSDGKDRGAPLHTQKPADTMDIGEARQFLQIGDDVRIIRKDSVIHFTIVPPQDL